MKRTAAAIFLATSIALPTSTAFADPGLFGQISQQASGHVEVIIDIEGSASTSTDRHDDDRYDDDRYDDDDHDRRTRRDRRDRSREDHARRDRRHKHRHKRKRKRRRRRTHDRHDHHQHTSDCDCDRHDRRDRSRHHHHDSCGHERGYDWAMSDQEFYNFLAQVRAENFKSGRMRLVRMVAHDNYFTARQVKQVVATLTFSSSKEDAAVLMYPRTVNQDDFYQVFAAFTFESSKEEVQERLGLI